MTCFIYSLRGCQRGNYRVGFFYTLGRGLVSNGRRVPVLSDRAATWSDAQQLTFDRAFIQYLDVSPDGEQLALRSDRDGNQDLWILSTTGGKMRQFTDDPVPEWQPVWSPDGSELAFYSYRSGNRDIWVVGVDGSGLRQVTQFDGPDVHPSWSPDGKELFFSAGAERGPNIWAVSIADGAERPMTDLDGRPGTLVREALATDGDYLYFASYEESGDLWVMDVVEDEPPHPK